ncbi:hypothetical protein DBP97_05580 [Lactobacillus helveticus]|uniref:Lipoprotein n=1 Tax=Lactobacillus helveticus TaxID=1587 RepID=A0A3S8SB51_LACHE|nr:hypothetical protein R0052_06885 [Lactobacillus helveticus R0052]AZK90831.1 hypothetical protein LH5_00570 [Lactobacillus helveticus]MED7628339.1 hypothetical protein [Lactobacillus helveticus]NRO63991.1 hypothetical protein [Lactobacillus helveticus]PTS34898.1 hypothetical protein DBP97_05580 [Lactobacillus helveticus]
MRFIIKVLVSCLLLITLSSCSFNKQATSYPKVKTIKVVDEPIFLKKPQINKVLPYSQLRLKDLPTKKTIYINPNQVLEHSKK